MVAKLVFGLIALLVLITAVVYRLFKYWETKEQLEHEQELAEQETRQELFENEDL